MAKPKLTLFLDIVSPFAYMAFYVTQNATVFKQCEIKYIPIFLGGVMKMCGNTPPMQIKNKAQWVGIERLRWAREFNIPMSETLAAGYPPMTLGVLLPMYPDLTKSHCGANQVPTQVMRAMCAILMTCPEKMPDTFSALYESLFVDENPRMNEVEGWKPVFEKVLGKERAGEIVKMSTTAEVKALLMKNSDEAFAEGAFGLPWWVATNTEGKKECFWGFDHTKQVIRHLGLDKSDEEADAGWRAML